MVVHLVHQCHDFFLRRVVRLNHSAFEFQGLACKRMVQVDLHLVLFYCYDLRHEALVLFVLQRDYCPRDYVDFVEDSIDAEYLLVEIKHAFCNILAESLCRSNGKFEALVC